MVARKRRFHPCLKNAFAIAFAHVKRIHCVYDFPPRIPIEFLHLVRPRKRFILHSAILKISHSSPCLHLQPDIVRMSLRMEDELKFLNIVLETGLISCDDDDLSYLSDKFCFFDLEREEISYNYL